MRIALVLVLAAAPAWAASPKSAAKPAAAPAASARFEGTRPLSILHVGAEGAPYQKTGGLGDVLLELPREQARAGHDVTRVHQLTSGIHPSQTLGFQHAGDVTVRVDNTPERVGVWSKMVEGVRHVLLQNRHFDTNTPYYGDGDFQEPRFLTLSQAVLRVPDVIGVKPDIVGLHDWPVAPAAAMARLQQSVPKTARDAKYVLTLHNAAFQGNYRDLAALRAGFASKHLAEDSLGHKGGFSFLKAGIRHADAVTTVGVNHAKELLVDGLGMEGVLREKGERFVGIPNGLSSHLWNPAADTAIPHEYRTRTVTEGKAANKAALQRDADLRRDPSVPMFAVVSRLTQAKGIDLVARAAEQALSYGAQLVITGTGEKEMEEEFAQLVLRFPGQVFFNRGFDEKMARKIFAAADFLVMPSRFEPGGLSNQQAQQYGALPIVSPVGGLVDSTTHMKDGLITEDLSVDSLAAAMWLAMMLHKDPAALKAARLAAMKRDKSWAGPVRLYEKLYYSLTGLPLPAPMPRKLS